MAAVKDEVEAELGELLDAGHRLLALAERPVDTRDRYSDADETGLELLDFLVFADPPKPMPASRSRVSSASASRSRC